MKFWGIILCVALLIGCSEPPKDGGYGSQLWEEEGYFVQKSIIADRLNEGIIHARVDGKWQEFALTELPEPLVDWSFKRRLETLAGIPKGEMPSLDGPHNGIVATYGYRREDSMFNTNNAIKGCGFLPKQEKLKEIIKKKISIL